MARKVQTLYVDDLTGTEIPEGEGGPVTFALDGHEYEIDLSSENADKMRDVLGRYVGAARRLTRQASAGTRRSSSGRSDADRERARAIRAWAVEHGHMRPESRGRIPAAIVDMYEGRHHAAAQTMLPTGSSEKDGASASSTMIPSPQASPAAPSSDTPRATPAPAATPAKAEPAKPEAAKAPQGETAKPVKATAAKKEAAKEKASA